jgi:hypothetical protein
VKRCAPNQYQCRSPRALWRHADDRADLERERRCPEMQHHARASVAVHIRDARLRRAILAAGPPTACRSTSGAPMSSRGRRRRASIGTSRSPVTFAPAEADERRTDQRATVFACERTGWPVQG